MVGEMNMLIALLLGSASLIHCEEQRVKSEGVCGESEGTGNIFTLTVNRRLNQSSGEWLRTFSARKVETGKPTGSLELEASQGSVECEGKGIMHVRVVVKEVKESDSAEAADEKNGPLVFHPRHGKNAVLLNDGRSVQKLDLNDPYNAVVFTHRPLKNNELFEVMLDKRTAENNNCLGLGVMTHSPDIVEILPSMFRHKNGTWMYINSAIYGANRELSKYGKDLNKIQPRDRVGVMRREDGSIHFVMNGVDLGRAVANVPEPVYGIFEVRNDAVKGTIVY